MKKLIILFISSMVIAAPSSFKVEGMMCGVSCVNKIKTQVGTLEGVKSCDVSFEKGMMIVDYDNSKLCFWMIIVPFYGLPYVISLQIVHMFRQGLMSPWFRS